MEKQLSLLASLKRNFPSVPMLEVENKCDVIRTGSGRMVVSALTGEGVEELRSEILKSLIPAMSGEPSPEKAI